MEVGVPGLQSAASMFGTCYFQQSASIGNTGQLRCCLDGTNLTRHQNLCLHAGNMKVIDYALLRRFAYFSSSYGSRLGEESQKKGMITMHRKYRLLVQASIDDEFRSSRNIALGLHRRYKKVVDRGYSNNIKEFITAGVTAYAVGCTDEGLRRELLSFRDSDEDIDATSSMGRITSLKSKLTSEEIEECILWLSIVFITILCTPQPTVVRWSSTSPVSAEAQLQWRGFCALIANAYYIRGMAWLPVKTLQLEQMAVMGRAEEPSLVADRMRLVFATLESVSPQWPKG